MNTHSGHALSGTTPATQEPHNDTAGNARADETDRLYTCLDCEQRLDSFTIKRPDCGSRQFQAEVPDASTSVRLPAYDLFEAALARFNPYTPR